MVYRCFKSRALRGFTLAEMLIALVLVGVIASMVVPKLLVSTTGKQRDAKLKQVVSLFETLTAIPDPTVTSKWEDYITTSLNGKSVTATALNACGTAASGTTYAKKSVQLKDGTLVTVSSNASVGASSGNVTICIDPLSSPANANGKGGNAGYVGNAALSSTGAPVTWATVKPTDNSGAPGLTLPAAGTSGQGVWEAFPAGVVN